MENQYSSERRFICWSEGFNGLFYVLLLDYFLVENLECCLYMNSAAALKKYRPIFEVRHNTNLGEMHVHYK